MTKFTQTNTGFEVKFNDVILGCISKENLGTQYIHVFRPSEFPRRLTSLVCGQIANKLQELDF